MSVESPAKSLTQAIYERLREDVLSCVQQPGSRVNLKELAHHYQASGGAVREALSRLTSEGLVVAEPQKGFRITPLSLTDLADLTQARVEMESSCLRHSIEHGDVAWEVRLVSAYHALSRTAGPAAGSQYDARAWNGVHTTFHEALVSACPNTWLLRMRKMLFEQYLRYQAMSVAMTAEHRGIGDEHKALLDAALNKDVNQVIELITHHIRETSTALMEGLQSAGRPENTTQSTGLNPAFIVELQRGWSSESGDQAMTTIAVLGLGAMGSRMALNLLRAGHTVTVWNRTAKAADELVAAGASYAATPKDAARGAAVVLSMVRDDAASRDVWLNPEHGAFCGMTASSIAIESSTLSHEWVLNLGQAAQAKGFSLIDAPVSGSRPQAETAQLVFLVGGAATTVEASREVLMAMGSSLHHVGPLGAGTLVKLATNALLGVQITTLAELFGMLGAHGVDLTKAFDAVGATSVSSVASQRSAASMLAGNFTPQFPVALIEKDFGYVVNAAGSPEAAPTIEAARKVFSSAGEQGLGELNMTSVVRLFAQD